MVRIVLLIKVATLSSMVRRRSLLLKNAWLTTKSTSLLKSHHPSTLGLQKSDLKQLNLTVLLNCSRCKLKQPIVQSKIQVLAITRAFTVRFLWSAKASRWLFYSAPSTVRLTSRSSLASASIVPRIQKWEKPLDPVLKRLKSFRVKKMPLIILLREVSPRPMSRRRELHMLSCYSKVNFCLTLASEATVHSKSHSSWATWLTS